MFFEFLESLNPPVSDLAAFLGVEHLPLPAMEFFVEIEDKVVMDKVHEGIAHIRLIFIVNRHIEEVVFPLVVLVDLLQKLPLAVLVRDVLNHHGGSRVLTILDPLDVDNERCMFIAVEAGLRVIVLDALMRLHPSAADAGPVVLAALLDALVGNNVEGGVGGAQPRVIRIHQREQRGPRQSRRHCLVQRQVVQVVRG